jgi:C1A family cysteine protease
MIATKKNRIVLTVAAVLAAGSLFFGVTPVSAKEKAWYEDLKLQLPDWEYSVEDGYLSSGGSNDVPSLGTSSQSGLKGAATVPSAYMNSLAQINAKYPSTRNQGSYNTCWAFSATGLAEFDLITDDGVADKTLDLSELQLAYFTYHNAEDAFGGTYGDSLQSSLSYLMSGGNLETCSRTLLQWQGMIAENDLSYTRAASTQTLSNDYAFSKNVAHLQNVYKINIQTDAAAVKKEIMNHGSAGIGLYVDDTVINVLNSRYIQSAVYDKTGETVSTYYYPNKASANHAVNIVGWDDDFPASAFSYTPSGNGAWLVRNSWSDTSENQFYSYFWLSYYDASIEDAAWIFDFESADNYDYNYQYDGCAIVSKTLGANVSVFANVFKVQGASNELLKAVSITMNEDVNVPYTIKIYANLTDPSKPRSGVLAATVTGKTTYAGTYTVPLDKAVSLPKGVYYSVVVELAKSGAGIDTEISYTYTGGTPRATAYADYDQSLIYYQDAWRDLGEIGSTKGIGNLCIKGYTVKTGTSMAQTKSLKKSAVKKTSVKLSWAKTSGATGYEVYRATSKNGTYKKVATVKSKKSYTNTKLKAGTTYYYKVRAYKKSGSTTVYGKLSSAVKVTTKKK